MRIVFVVPPSRVDFYNYLQKLEEHELILLWYEKKTDESLPIKDLPLKFNSEIYWGDYRTPKKLLKKIRPDKIVFFEIIDLRQIALIVAAKSLKITTFYLEHGAAGDKNTAIARWEETTFKNDSFPYLLKRLQKSFLNVIKSKWFYYSIKKGFKSFNSYGKYFKLPFLMLKGSPNKVLAHCKFNERVPDKAIVFNQVNFEQFELYTGISINNAALTGVPMFDKFYSNKTNEEDHYVYIDHPYLEEKLLGWTKEHHRHIAETLFRFAETNRIKIFIKLHPVSKMETWQEYQYNKEYIEILQRGDFTETYLKSKLILGFSSSLITGFLCAKKNVVLLGWHPEPQIFGVNFSETGLCHKSFYSSELLSEHASWVENNLTTQNRAAYIKYLQKFNYPFDGQATERVIRTITGDDIS